MSRPLVVSVHGARDAVVLVRDGRVWLLRDNRWHELASHVAAPGVGGHVMSETQAQALFARVGQP